MPAAMHKDFLKALQGIVPKDRIYTDPLRRLAYGTDASHYRLTPEIVVDAETETEVVELLRLARRTRVPVTFRAAGTSLSGQAITDSVLVRLGRGWKRCRVGENAETIFLEPGVIGATANALLAEFGRKIGPDPASIDSCMIGGIVANNASGMCCGTADNSYKTLVSARLVLADGAQLDTGDAKSRAAFVRSHAPILDGLIALHERVLADTALSERIRRKFAIKNTTGYSINALVDFNDPFDILLHLMVGSEGTLGFVSEVTYRTVADFAHKASALLLFPSVRAACDATVTLKTTPVDAVELMDRASLRSVEGQPGLPAGLECLGPEACSLLVETRAISSQALGAQIKKITAALEKHPTVQPFAFTRDAGEAAMLWRVRKGILPSVGGMRAKNTSSLIEDVAVPMEHLADAALALQVLFDKYGYAPAPLFGHARDGNLHFVINPDFSKAENIVLYEKFMDELCRTITERYDGSLKAEHGTGRNIAPFVEMEWGAEAHALMWDIKRLLDPAGILNPGVVLNTDPQVHTKNLKPLLSVHEGIDKCTECGFCEATCPSRGITLTPRQRITTWREIQRLKSSPANASDQGARARQLEKSYQYMANETCAADGLCALRCPVQINTGTFIKTQRHDQNGKAGKAVAGFVAGHFHGVCRTASGLLTAVDAVHRTVGSSVMANGSRLLRTVTFGKSPLWNKAMPRVGAGLPAVVTRPDNPRKVVYFPSCISRSMGPGQEHTDTRSEPEVMISLLLKAGYEVIFPKELEKLCCGMAFASKGFFEQAEDKARELHAALLEASKDGAYPIVSETSPCLLHMKETLNAEPGARLALYEPVSFILEILQQDLDFTRLPRSVALHTTCSARKMDLGAKFQALAALCAEQVVVPEGIECCGFAGDRGFTHPELNASALRSLRFQVGHCDAGYSTSRTCQVGLSLHSGIPYYSILFLVDEATKRKGG